MIRWSNSLEPPTIWGNTYLGERSKYIEEAKPFLWFPYVYHYLYGAGQAVEYRGIYWHVRWMRGDTTWINRRALKLLAY